MDSKQRKIRSLRGFFLYALEIIENGKDYEILNTNLQPFFWRKVKTILRQNKKTVLLEFLFEKHQDHKSDSFALEKKIQNLQNQVKFLQQKIIDLEAMLESIQQGKDKGLDKPNFITLGKITEQEKIKIIQIGFQRQAEGKISLKKYYESTDPNSFFQSKGYSIKYESIRRTKLYQQLKPSNN